MSQFFCKMELYLLLPFLVRGRAVKLFQVFLQQSYRIVILTRDYFIDEKFELAFSFKSKIIASLNDLH